MSLRPDSEGQECGFWHEGQPGTGVLAMDLSRWRPPQLHRIGGNLYRFTAPADVPLLRARAALSPCHGDGHYECRLCVFWRAAACGSKE